MQTNPSPSDPGALPTPTLLLASSSRWRRQLLEDAGLACGIVAPELDEDAVWGVDPVDTARARARAKALEVAERHPHALVIGADQVLWEPDASQGPGGEAIGKPPDLALWRARLLALRGRWHGLTTAVYLAAPAALGGDEAFEEHSRVHMRADASEAEVDAYIAWGEARGCAGGYMVERRGAWLVQAVEGDWHNVVGLPVLALVGRLRARGWTLGSGGQGQPARDTGRA